MNGRHGQQLPAEPLTARTRQHMDSLQVSSDTVFEQPPSQQREPVHFAPVAPSRVESRLSVGEGGLDISEDELSEHPFAEADEADMPSHRDGNGGAGNALPGDFTTDSDLIEGHEPIDEEGAVPLPVPVEAEKKKEVKAPYGWPPARDYPKWYLRRLIGYDQSQDVYGFYPSWDQITAFVFTCITMVVLGLINHYGFSHLGDGTIGAFIPAFGASCTVVYGVPKAPIAQPRNILIAHVSAAIIGVALTNAFRSVSDQPFGQHCAGAIGVGLHLSLMMVTNTMHPPASATVISAATNPLNTYFEDEGFLFCLTPVLFGSLVLLIMAWLLNNLFEERGPYPQYW